MSETIREMKTPAEYHACVEMQRATWGETFQDVVPGSILKITQRIGGVAAGAFSPEGELLGFVYGVTGVEAGVLVHWSHMLAVKPDLRDHGLGRKLKEYQREVLRSRNVQLMYWTYDPLVARNAHLNLNRLGAEVRDFVPDMYGDTGSPAHAVSTDRFVVSWRLDEDPRETAAVHADETPIVNAANGSPTTSSLLPDAQRVRIQVPDDLDLLRTENLDEARMWSASVRRALSYYLGNGYRVQSFGRNSAGCFYILSQAR